MSKLIFENFSAGYYRTEMTIEEYDDGPVIEQSLYDFIKNQLYQNIDTAPVFKLGLNTGAHFTPSIESGIPVDVLAVPTSWVDTEDRLRDSQNVFVLKPGQSQYVAEFTVGDEE